MYSKQTKKIAFIYLFCVCVSVWGACVTPVSEGQLTTCRNQGPPSTVWVLGLNLVIRLGSMRPYPLQHLSGHFLGQQVLKLMTFLPQPPEGWGYSHVTAWADENPSDVWTLLTQTADSTLQHVPVCEAKRPQVWAHPPRGQNPDYHLEAGCGRC